MTVTRWEYLLARLALVLLVLAVASPLLGRATPVQTVSLAVLTAVALYVLGDTLVLSWVLPRVQGGLSAATNGAVAAIVIRYLAPVLGVGYDWGAASILGAAVGLGVYLLPRGLGMRSPRREGAGRELG